MILDVNIRFLAAAAMIAGAAALTGCSGSDPVSGPEPPVIPPVPNEDAEAISIVAMTGGETPKSAKSREKTPLQSIFSDFGVYACKTASNGSVQHVLVNEAGAPYEVRYVESSPSLKKWTYTLSSSLALSGLEQYERYWDLSARDYTFTAYAPYSIGGVAATETHTITADASGVSISGIEGNKAMDSSPDWLEARWKRVNGTTVSDYDLLSANPSTPVANPASLTSDVPLVFHNILSAVVFRIYTEDQAPLTVTDFSVTFGDEDAISILGDYSAGSWTLSSTSTATTVCDLTGMELLIPIGGIDNAVVVTNRVEIPQTVSGRTINVTIVIDDGTTHTGAFPLPESWSPDKQYTYNFNLSASGNVILMDVNVDKYNWRPGNDIDVDEPVINW